MSVRLHCASYDVSAYSVYGFALLSVLIIRIRATDLKHRTVKQLKKIKRHHTFEYNRLRILLRFHAISHPIFYINSSLKTFYIENMRSRNFPDFDVRIYNGADVAALMVCEWPFKTIIH